MTPLPSFLDELAEQVLEQANPERCLVILPSQRAAAKFERALLNQMDRASWLPKVQTLGKAIQEHTKWTPLTSMESLALLYQIWVQLPQKTEGDDQQKSFRSFMPWGRIALRDFNEIDQHLKPAREVFQNLCDIEGIEDWSFGDSSQLKSGQIAFLRQYLQLGELYEALIQTLQRRRQGYAGLMARKASEMQVKLGYEQVFVAGMSALTPAELSFLNAYEKSDQLTWVWDGDESYVRQTNVEAGMFIRANRERTGQTQSKLPNRLSNHPPKIVQVQCSSNVLQCQYVRKCIEQLDENERARTAIILPDGSQLPLLLQSLPTTLQKSFNVTMGLGWGDTPARGFFRTIQHILSRNNRSWHHEDIRKLLSEPLLHQAYQDSSFQDDANHVLNEMARRKWAWVSAPQLKELSGGPVAEFFAKFQVLQFQETLPFLTALSKWASGIGQMLEANEACDPWTSTGWKKVIQVLSIAIRFESQHRILQSVEDGWAFLWNALQGERIDLLGEPEAGIQIMGLIETRAMDFDRIYVMDCNEGTLPKSSPPESFIPFDLRYMWGLPGRHQREAIFAYYTYRLLNRSTEIHFLYRGQDESAEKSRYLLQFERSFRPNGQDLLAMAQEKTQVPLPEMRPEIQPIQWSEWSRKQLVDWSKKGISPSAWNTFMACKRDFYYKYLLKLHEQDEFEDEMSSSTFGTVVHKVLEDGLAKLKDDVLKRDDLIELKKNVSGLLRESVAEGYNLALTENGENYLHFAMAEATLNKLIDVEIKELEQIKDRKVLEVEMDLSHSFETDHPVFSSIRLHGKADRVDIEKGQVFVTDYKTGSVKSNDLALKGEWTEKLATGKAGKALQLLMYAAISLETLRVDGKPVDSVQSGIRSGRNAKVGLLSLSIDGHQMIERNDAQKLLNWLVSQLNDVHVGGEAVHHNEDASYCAYCTVLDPPIRYFG